MPLFRQAIGLGRYGVTREVLGCRNDAVCSGHTKRLSRWAATANNER